MTPLALGGSDNGSIGQVFIDEGGGEDLRRHGMVSLIRAHSTKPNFVQRREV